MIIDDIRYAFNSVRNALAMLNAQVARLRSDVDLSEDFWPQIVDPVSLDFAPYAANFTGGIVRWGDHTNVTSALSFIPGWAFSRTDTNCTTTAFRADGTVATFASGAPRITDRGLLIEEGRTNLATASQVFSGGAWTPTNLTATDNQIAAPDLTTTAALLNEGTASGVHSIFTTFTSVSGTSYTTSFFLRNLDRRFVQVFFGSAGHGSNAFANFDLQTGTVGTVGSAATATITALANGWYRCTCTAPATASSASASAQLSMITSATAARAENYTGTSLRLYVWGAQVEAGSFPTSPIITTGAAGTRGVDLPSLPILLPDAYTIVTEAEVPFAQSGLFPTVVSTSGTNNGLFLTGTNLPGFSLSNGTYTSTVPGSLTTGTIVRHAVRAETNNVRGAVNGTLAALGTTFSPITGSRILYIGSNIEITSRLNGYVRRIRIIPRSASDTELQSLTL